MWKDEIFFLFSFVLINGFNEFLVEWFVLIYIKIIGLFFCVGSKDSNCVFSFFIVDFLLWNMWVECCVFLKKGDFKFIGFIFYI